MKSPYRHLKDRDEAQDVAQEVMIRIMTKLPNFRGEGPFTAWRDKIIYNRCSDHLKQDKGLLHQEISEKIIDSLADELAAEGEEVPTVEELHEFMEQISGEAKRILLLKYEQGWSGKAIEEALHLSEGAAKMRLARARLKLQQLLNKRRISSEK